MSARTSHPLSRTRLVATEIRSIGDGGNDMKTKLTTLCLILLFGSVVNAQKQTIWVTAVTHNSNLIRATATYQTPGYSQANCNGAATTNGNITYRNANCSGTYTAPQQ